MTMKGKTRYKVGPLLYCTIFESEMNLEKTATV